jgi:ketol-acid reductoisomerase
MIIEPQIDSGLIKDLAVAVVGYGNQGRAHALNLRDSGIKVTVGAREGRGRNWALDDGFEPTDIQIAVQFADVVVMTVPDEQMKPVFDGLVGPWLKHNATLLFAHGFAVVYEEIVPPFGAVLVSPAGPGKAVRDSYVEGGGVVAYVAAEPATLMPLAKSYGSAIGSSRVGLIPTTFREEVECDLFGEQVVLCGGMPLLALEAYASLVKAGYSRDVAYHECVAQIRLLADLMATRGIMGMWDGISDTAEWGALTVGPKIVSEEVKLAMSSALDRVRSGEFAREWIAEARSGKPNLDALRKSATDRLAELGLD